MATEDTFLQQQENKTFLKNEQIETHRGAIAKKQRLRFLVLTLLIASLIGYLIYSGIRDTMGYYLTVDEMLAQGAQLSQESIRVSGKVSEGSVNWDPGERILHFTITDEKSPSTLSVVYQGNVPDSFKQGQKVILEGVYTNGVFTASQLMTTCASKYE